MLIRGSIYCPAGLELRSSCLSLLRVLITGFCYIPLEILIKAFN